MNGPSGLWRRGDPAVANDSGRDAEMRLIQRVGDGDMAAFEQLYRLFHPRLSRFLTGITHMPPIVEEVLNDTMMVVWKTAGTYRGESRLATWIFAIAYRKAMKALRRQDLPVEAPAMELAVSDTPEPDAAFDHARSRRRLVQALSGLTADHRTVVELTYFHGLNYRDIAEIMDCPVDTVKTRMFHARRKLRHLLAGEAGDWLWTV